jgi:hypoxanthine-DNA glycosylase
MKKYSFAPIVDEICRILILGSMPGEESIRQHQYYTNPRNQFWKIIYHIYNAEMDGDYHKKTEFLLSKQIALWDVIESCHRKE